MEGPAFSAWPDQGKVIMHAAALVATGTAGFLAGGAAGAAAGVLAWAVVLVACWRLRARNAQALPSTYADFDDVIDRLDDFARERNWSLGKRFAIARMVCENPTMTVDALEQRYDRELRSAPDRIRRDASEGPKNDIS